MTYVILDRISVISWGCVLIQASKHETLLQTGFVKTLESIDIPWKQQGDNFMRWEMHRRHGYAFLELLGSFVMATFVDEEQA